MLCSFRYFQQCNGITHIHFFYRLTEDDLKENSVIQLRFVKFQNVTSITVST